MKVFDGNLERLGWEVRQVDEGVQAKLGTVLLPTAVSLMVEAEALAEAVDLREGLSGGDLRLTRSMACGFIRLSGIKREPLGLRNLVNAFPGILESQIKVPPRIYPAYSDFSTTASDLLGANGSIGHGKVDRWALARYRSKGELGERKDGKFVVGHYDRAPHDMVVSSIQLTETDAEWEIRYVEEGDNRQQVNTFVQKPGQAVVLKSSRRQLVEKPENEHELSATPWHYVRNLTRAERYTYLQVEYLGAEAEPETPFLPWGMGWFKR